MAIGEDSKSILLNPANLSTFSNNEIKIELLNSSIALNRDTLNFIDGLNSSNSNQEVSQLMKKNIGKALTFNANNFISIYQSKNSYSYLLGLYSDIDGYFITHTGFGSMGAMESYIDRYNSIVGNLSFKNRNFIYGFNLRAVNRYKTIRNYTINEIIENDSILNYFDNRYTKKEETIAFDIGGIYKKERSNFALSILDIGNSSFKTLGVTRSTTNIGYSNIYKEYIFGIDYIDIFQSKKNSSFENSIRLGVSRNFFNKDLTLNSGILNQALSYGVKYRYSIFNISLSSYKIEEFNSIKNRKYQLSISLKW